MRFLPRVTVVAKSIAITTFVVTAVVWVMWVRVTSGFEENIRNKFLSQSQTIARSLALAIESAEGETVDEIAGGGSFKAFLRASADAPGVAYIYAQDNEGSILNHTWDKFPPYFLDINRIEVGMRGSSDSRDETTTTRDIPEESLMLTGDENIVDVDFVVFWRIANAADYLFNIQNPEGTVKAVAESSMREIVGQSDIEPILTEARAKTEADVQKLMQTMLDGYGSGVHAPGGRSGTRRAIIPVYVKPGIRRCAVTRQPGRLRSVWARPSVRAFTADLLTLYAVSPGGCVMPCFEPVLMTRPGSPLSAMAGTKACTPCSTPKKLTPMTRVQPSGLDRASPPPATPALFISTETGPNSPAILAARVSTALRSLTSVAKVA